jgi:hypothetical protein
MRALRRLRTAALAVAGIGVLAAAAERGDPVAKISAAPTASEYWDFVATFDSNERLLARFLITNEGPGEASAFAVGHFIRADGTAVPFRNGRLAGAWTLAEDRRSLRIGSSRLDLSGPEIALDVDNKKRGFQIHLRMRPGPQVSAGPELPDTAVDVLALAAPVTGTFWSTGMSAPQSLSGRAGISHTWMDPRESERVVRRFDFFGRDGALALYLGDAVAPDGRRAQVLLIERDGKSVLNVTEITIAHGDEKKIDLGADYPVPKQLIVTGIGISGVINLNRVLVHPEPIQDLPLLFRFLLSSVTHPQRVWMDSRFEVRIERSPLSTSLQAQGSGITSVTFSNPLPSATSQRHATD